MNNSAAAVVPYPVVSHVEHPNPNIVVSSVELWNGVQNPRAADGVVLSTNTGANAYVYTIPKSIQIVESGRIDVGNDATRNFQFLFVDSDLELGSSGLFNIAVTGVRYPTGRTLTLNLGGGSIRAGGVGGTIGTLSPHVVGTRSLAITNVTDVTLDTLANRADDATKGQIVVHAAGKVTARLLDNSDGVGGGGSAASITVRAAQIDVRDVNVSAARTGSSVANGNVILEALKAPQYDPTRPINSRENTLVLRGLLKTHGGRTDHTQGNVTLRAGVVTFDTSFVTNIAPSGTFAIFAGDREPHATYFVDNSSSGPFTATHNVQLVAPPGTMIAIR